MGLRPGTMALNNSDFEAVRSDCCSSTTDCPPGFDRRTRGVVQGRVVMINAAEKLAAFSAWASAHISGDEKGEAQIFLDRLFQAFGHPGSLDVGGEPEFRVRKATEDGGGTSFADYVWK